MDKNEKSVSSTKTNTSKGFLGIGAIFLGILVALLFGWIVFPKLLFSQKTQPINFNHKLHVETVGLDCATCHMAGKNDSFSGLPPLATCAECHSTPQGDSAEEARLIKEYIEPQKEIKWVVYNKMPDNVFFSHDAHSAKSCNSKGCHDYKEPDLCKQCHIPVWTMSKEPVAQVNKLTGYTLNSMSMDTCERCHANENHRDGMTNANNLCFTCHK